MLKLFSGALLRHYKGGLYRVINPHVVHTETLQKLVVYKSEDENDTRIWARPRDMFENKIVYGGKEQQRFVNQLLEKKVKVKFPL